MKFKGLRKLRSANGLQGVHKRQRRAAALRYMPLRFEPLEERTLLAVVLWDGGPAGTGANWNDPVNWAGNVLPGGSDDAQIGAAFAGITITSSSNVSVRSVTSAAPLQITAGTYALGL